MEEFADGKKTFIQPLYIKEFRYVTHRYNYCTSRNFGMYNIATSNDLLSGLQFVGGFAIIYFQIGALGLSMEWFNIQS